MIRKEAIEIICKKLGKYPIVAANGYISRDLCAVLDKPNNFYMIGSMGLSSSIGLGLALKNPRKLIIVFDGDGNILMNLGSLATIGALKPTNLVHIIFDNSSHESTGGQPTCTTVIKIDEIAKSVNYKTYKTTTKKNLIEIIDKIKNISGPIMIIIKIRTGGLVNKRISIDPVRIKQRFMRSLVK